MKLVTSNDLLSIHGSILENDVGVLDASNAAKPPVAIKLPTPSQDVSSGMGVNEVDQGSEDEESQFVAISISF